MQKSQTFSFCSVKPIMVFKFSRIEFYLFMYTTHKVVGNNICGVLKTYPTCIVRLKSLALVIHIEYISNKSNVLRKNIFASYTNIGWWIGPENCEPRTCRTFEF